MNEKKESAQQSGSNSAAIGTVIFCIGAILLLSAIWAGGSTGWPGLFTSLAGLFVYSFSPEGRAAEAARKSGQAVQARTQVESVPAGGKRLLSLRIDSDMAYADGQLPICVKEARATVETSGTVTSRATMTRMVTGAIIAGPVGAIIGYGAKKKVDDRVIFVLIQDTEGSQILLSSGKENEAEVRRWAAQFNTWASNMAR